MNSEVKSVSLKIAELLKSAVKCEGSGTALAFSGGLDSTILMAASDSSLIPYTVGIEGSRDLSNARNASEMLGWSINEVIINTDNVTAYRRILEQIDPAITKVELGYEIVLAAVLDNIKEETLVTGQGADELFYGYRRFIDNPEIDNASHLEKLFSVTLPRERKLADHFGKSLSTPYLNENIFNLAAGFGRNEHIKGSTNKVILREVAHLLGLPDEIARKPKKAAQYGSGVQRFISRMRE